VSNTLTFAVVDTSRIVTSFNELWSHNVANTVIMLPTVYTVVTIFYSSYYVFVCTLKYLSNFKPYFTPHRQLVEIFYDC